MEAMNLAKVNELLHALRKEVDITDYSSLVGMADSLVESGRAGPGGEYEDLFLIVADLIEAHDKREFQIPDASPEVVLRFLMKQHNISQSQLPEVGNQSVVSQILSGHRQLNSRQIAELRARFGVSADAFIPRTAAGALVAA